MLWENDGQTHLKVVSYSSLKALRETELNSALQLFFLGMCKVLGSTHSPAKQTPQKTIVAVPEVCLAKTTLSALFTTP